MMREHDVVQVAARPDMVGKALSLLTLLGGHSRGAAATTLARESHLPLSTAHRLMGALVRDGYATFDATTKQYALGLRVYQLAQNVARTNGWTGMTRSILEEVSVTTREATVLAVLDGDHLIYVYSIEGPQQVSVVGEPGKPGPLHCTAVDKVLVAFAADDVREHLVDRLPLPPHGPHSIVSRARFRDEVEGVRRAGYAIADEEHEAGIRAIAVPVPGERAAVAALSTAAPAYRMSVEQLTEHLPTLVRSAGSLAAVMPPD